VQTQKASEEACQVQKTENGGAISQDRPTKTQLRITEVYPAKCK
jgi:hypothetical protein